MEDISLFLSSEALIRVLPAGREAKGKPRLWAKLHLIASVGLGRNTCLWFRAPCADIHCMHRHTYTPIFAQFSLSVFYLDIFQLFELVLSHRVIDSD